MPNSLPLDSFLKSQSPIFDVRSPAEFNQGHIPGSISLPLFDDQERSIIGTAYKQESREIAIDLGLKIVGPKLFDLVNSAKQHIHNKEANILCWRGGMRSGFVARLLESIGFNTSTLQGGYKSFRRDVLKSLENTSIPQLFILGGFTGSGKTSILEQLNHLGEQVIDLEAIAGHRGSAFGLLGLPPQMSQEQFENKLAHTLKQLDLSKPIWIEDESRMIGKCRIPTALFDSMAQAKFIHIDINKELRIQHLISIYGNAPIDELVQSTTRIERKLGIQLTNKIINLFINNDKASAFDLLLTYYDKTYSHYLNQRKDKNLLKDLSMSFSQWAIYLRDLYQEQSKSKL
ncbi:MAG: tRNA 2-selenouridine(34) synthase MnmH [Parachlamydiaceae bacterium]|nr:tRNA 2-selenouridine(34) synthase MnmH [Parachlamydiaceae bacterium]